MKITKKKVAAFAILGVLILGMMGCESWDRMTKTWGSDFGGGLNRKVTVYDINGNEIKSYEGKFDVEDDESKVLFDIDGKRVIIYNAVVINEEV